MRYLQKLGGNCVCRPTHPFPMYGGKARGYGLPMREREVDGEGMERREGPSNGTPPKMQSHDSARDTTIARQRENERVIGEEEGMA